MKNTNAVARANTNKNGNKGAKKVLKALIWIAVIIVVLIAIIANGGKTDYRQFSNDTKHHAKYREIVMNETNDILGANTVSFSPNPENYTYTAIDNGKAVLTMAIVKDPVSGINYKVDCLFTIDSENGNKYTIEYYNFDGMVLADSGKYDKQLNEYGLTTLD